MIEEGIMTTTVVIADDITGSNDIGIMYTKAGLESVVYSYDRLEYNQVFDDEIVIIDTNSRFLDTKDAYTRVYNATKRFDKGEVKQFFSKQCSVFRGNIGAEFDAMLDALEEEFAIVVLGFPDNGRTTIQGTHYVNGVRLEDSQFRDDPVHPMTRSNLVEILESQTKRKVSTIYHEDLDRGLEFLKEKIRHMKAITNYLIFDVRDNDDLRLIAQAVKDEKIICGSSALGYYLGLLNKSNVMDKPMEIGGNHANNRILCIAGSLTPQTRSQVQYMKNRNFPVITLDTIKLLDNEGYEDEKQRVLKACHQGYESNDMVIIHSMNQPHEVQRTKMIGLEKGKDNIHVSKLVSDTLSDIAYIIGEKYNVDKFIICGGDTSASFCDRMNIEGIKVLAEIEPGLPLGQSITLPYYQLVLKSGSFGSEEFLIKAKAILNNG